MNLRAYLDESRQHRETHSKSRGRRVKIEKVGHAWLVRFLPVQLGKRGLFFVQQGQHWLNKQPIFCPRWVATDFGGDPDAECPVCALADELNDMENEELSKFGFRLRANITYLTYCLVFQIDRGRGEAEEMPASEIVKPWEFQHYSSSFDELHDYFKRGQTSKRPWSVLDLAAGNDFWATKTKKGTRLDRQDPGPILEMDATFEKTMDTIFQQIAKPRIEIPTLKQLEIFARKSEGAAYGETPGDDTSRGSDRGREDDGASSEGEDVDRPSRRLGRSGGGAPSRRPSRLAPQEEEQQPEAEAEQAEAEQGEPQEESQDQDAPPAEEGDDQVPGAEVPAQRAAPAARAGVARPAARPAAAPRPAPRLAPSPAPAGRPAVAAARPGAAAARPGVPAVAAARPGVPAARPAAAAAAARPAAAKVAPAAAARPVAAARPAAKPAAPAPARRLAPATVAPVESSVSEEEDAGVAEEQNDQAAPAEEPLGDQEAGQEPENQEAEGQEAAQGEGGDVEEAPPAPAPAGGMRNRLLGRLKGAPR